MRRLEIFAPHAVEEEGLSNAPVIQHALGRHRRVCVRMPVGNPRVGLLSGRRPRNGSPVHRPDKHVLVINTYVRVRARTCARYGGYTPIDTHAVLTYVARVREPNAVRREYTRNVVEPYAVFDS